eukprot:329628-Pyramimonas_sp.AAC.1
MALRTCMLRSKGDLEAFRKTGAQIINWGQDRKTGEIRMEYWMPDAEPVKQKPIDVDTTDSADEEMPEASPAPSPSRRHGAWSEAQAGAEQREVQPPSIFDAATLPDDVPLDELLTVAGAPSTNKGVEVGASDTEESQQQDRWTE